MTQATWNAVDDYLSQLLLPDDRGLAATREASAAAGLPAIAVSPLLGQLLSIMARAQGARRILEIGTLGGYSALWLARALPRNGRLVSLELEQKHASIARDNLARAGFTLPVVEIRVGPAIESLRSLVAEGGDPFDFIFIDADKAGYPAYLEMALALARPGTLIVADNVVREGAVTDGDSADPNVKGVRRYLEMAAAEPRLVSTAIQTVGVKGYDGLAVALVTGGPDPGSPP